MRILFLIVIILFTAQGIWNLLDNYIDLFFVDVLFIGLALFFYFIS